jgi:hypothetical protein
MRIILILSIVTSIVFAGCAKDAKVTIIKPRIAAEIPIADSDRLARQKIQRATKEKPSDPLLALGTLVEALDQSAEQLDRNPTDAIARHDYNFAIARIVDIMREQRLAPWKAPIQLGTHYTRMASTSACRVGSSALRVHSDGRTQDQRRGL